MAAAWLVWFLDRGMPPDGGEADNLLGGEMIARGYRLYVADFSQHIPLPYHLAAVAARLGVHDPGRSPNPPRRPV